MKYTQPTFSVPTGNGRISQTDYEIRVGLRCSKCEGLLSSTKHLCLPGKGDIHITTLPNTVIKCY